MKPSRLTAKSSDAQSVREAVRFSLRPKLLALSLLLVAVPGAVFAALAFSAAHDALRSAAGRQLVEAARDQADNIAVEMTNVRDDLHRWARNEVMRDIMVEDVDKRIARLLQTIQKGGESYFDLICANTDGEVVAASAPGLVGQSIKIGLSQRVNTIRGPISRSPYPRPLFEAREVIPHPDQPERSIGVLVAYYDSGALDRTALQLRENLAELGTRVGISILNEDGTVIGGSWDGSWGGSWSRSGSGTGQETVAAPIGQNLRDAGWNSARSRMPDAPSRGFEEEQVAQVFAGYSDLDAVRADWRVLVTQPIGEALAPVANLRRRWTIALAAVVLVGLLMAGLLAERMIRPLQALTEATQEIRLLGEETKLLAVTSSDEIGQLTAAFNTMASELRRARRELINAARLALVGEMAAGIAHEVRTPLGILRTAAQVLRRSTDARTPKETELLDIMVAETDRLSHVVNEFLDLAGPKVPSAQSAYLEPVLARAVEFVNAQAVHKGVTLRQDFTDDPSPAWCDPEQIYQVALNLIVNATQSLDSGGTVVVRLDPARSGRVAFEVADDGPGISDDVQEKIFAPFFTTRESGTGLGLALVDRIVTAHRGTLSVTSSKGTGATFRVTLPVAEEVA